MAKTWELIRQELETYSLVFPSVSFILEDTSCIQNASIRKERIVKIPKVRAKNALYLSLSKFNIFPNTQSDTTLARFRHLFGHALTEVFVNL